MPQYTQYNFITVLFYFFFVSKLPRVQTDVDFELVCPKLFHFRRFYYFYKLYTATADKIESLSTTVRIIPFEKKNKSTTTERKSRKIREIGKSEI